MEGLIKERMRLMQGSLCGGKNGTKELLLGSCTKTGFSTNRSGLLGRASPPSQPISLRLRKSSKVLVRLTEKVVLNKLISGILAHGQGNCRLRMFNYYHKNIFILTYSRKAEKDLYGAVNSFINDMHRKMGIRLVMFTSYLNEEDEAVCSK